MFILMYLNTYAWEHIFFSETRTYMAIVMGATMAIIMLAYMLGMYSVTVRALGDESDWRQNAELVFELDQGLTVGYRGFYECDAGSGIQVRAMPSE